MKKKIGSITLRRCKQCKIITYFERNPATDKSECRNCRWTWKGIEIIAGYKNKTPIITKQEANK